MPFICFDLEGPLSPQDHAYEVAGLIPDGKILFAVLSRYDDILTLEGRENHEPGDTLKFIIPFLIWGRIAEEHLERISRQAKLTNGAEELIKSLRKAGWLVIIVSTSYHQHGFSIAQRLNIPLQNVFCTKFPLNDLRKGLGGKELSIIGAVKGRIIQRYSKCSESDEKNQEMKRYLDKIFGKTFPAFPGINKILQTVEVMGGSRKVEALKKALQALS